MIFGDLFGLFLEALEFRDGLRGDISGAAANSCHHKGRDDA